MKIPIDAVWIFRCAATTSAVFLLGFDLLSGVVRAQFASSLNTFTGEMGANCSFANLPESHTLDFISQVTPNRLQSSPGPSFQVTSNSQVSLTVEFFRVEIPLGYVPDEVFAVWNGRTNSVARDVNVAGVPILMTDTPGTHEASLNVWIYGATEIGRYVYVATVTRLQ